MPGSFPEDLPKDLRERLSAPAADPELANLTPAQQKERQRRLAKRRLLRPA